jgi:hypothetical protein
MSYARKLHKQAEENETTADKELRLFGLLKFKSGRRFLDYKTFPLSTDD